MRAGWILLVAMVGCQGLTPLTDGVVRCVGDDCSYGVWIDRGGGGDGGGDDTDDGPVPSADCPDPVDCDDAACASVCDVDGDGFVDDAQGGGDCDDGDEDVNPDADEVCDGVDNDCDDDVDDDDDDVEALTWYLDGDGDGYGLTSASQEACDPGSAPASQVSGDCADDDADVNPGAAEVTCDGLNNDCGANDDDPDGDGDGVGVCDDCDDVNDQIFPGATEVCGDSVDSNCDGRDCAGFEDDFEGSAQLGAWWATSGAAVWVTNTVQVHGGARSAASGDIGDNQVSNLVVNFTWSAPGTIAFWHREDTEANYDYLRFFVDGIERGSWSGSTAWARAQYNVSAGPHELKWQYDKDVNQSVGADRVWIDDVIGQ